MYNENPTSCCCCCLSISFLMVCNRSLFFCCASNRSTCGLQPHVYTFSSSSITTLWKNPADISLTGLGNPLTMTGLVIFEEEKEKHDA